VSAGVRIVSLRLNPKSSVKRTKEMIENPAPEGRVVEVQPVLLRVEEVAKALGIGRSEVFRLLREERLRSVKVGRRRLIPRAELDKFVREEVARQENR
jgi:excisionase family DNA binding protein